MPGTRSAAPPFRCTPPACRKPLPQPPGQLREPGALGRQLAQRELARRAEADDLVRRQRPGAQAALLSAAVHQRLQQAARTAAHVERADTLGAIELVCRERGEIQRQRGERQRHLARRLCAVAVQGDTALATQRAERRHVFKHAGLVVGVHHRGQHRIGAQRRGEQRRVEPTGTRRREPGDAEAFALEAPAWIEHRLVLSAYGDDVPPAVGVGARAAEDGQVVGFGGARGEDDLRRLHAEQRGDLRPRLLDARGGARAWAV